MSAKPPEPLGPGRSGVYRAPPDLQPLKQRAVQAGLAWLPVDLAPVGEKSRFLAVCAEDLGFPKTFGHNWDAFADCLQDFSWRTAPGYVVHLRNAAVFAMAAPAEWATAREILSEAAGFWAARGKTFLVLVHGAADLPAFEA
ncbi:MAG: barstar family protein [Betaproteobacteria bacterium]|nr:barstar family protein [Betaproteobacteria bacterium]